MSYTFTIKDDFETLLDITISKDAFHSEKNMEYSLLERLFVSVFQNIREKQKDTESFDSAVDETDEE